jgi:hypothetical protein
MMENGQGEERKINGELATPVLVADGEWRLKQNLRKMEGSLTYILFTEPLTIPLAEDIYIVRFVSIPTSYKYSNRPQLKTQHAVQPAITISPYDRSNI